MVMPLPTLRSKCACSLSFLLLTAAATVNAQLMRTFVVFGDSNSDIGRVDPGANYFNKRYSNGPIYVDQLVSIAQVNSLNYAVSGGVACKENIAPNYGYMSLAYHLDAQVQQFLRENPGPLNNATAFVWLGDNDLLYGALFSRLASTSSPAGQAYMDGIVNCLSSGIAALRNSGKFRAIYFGSTSSNDLLPISNSNLMSGSTRDNLRSAVLLTNQKLTAKLAADVPSAKYVDLDTLMRNTINTKAAPFTDVTTQCLNNNRKCASEATHFFWDDTHLTTVAHEKVNLPPLLTQLRADGLVAPAPPSPPPAPPSPPRPPAPPNAAAMPHTHTLTMLLLAGLLASVMLF